MDKLRSFPPLEPAHPEGFLHHRWRGKCYPPFIDRRATAQLDRSWEIAANDVLICSHQKVGTHLAKKFLVELIRTCGNLGEHHPLSGGDIGHDAVPWPEVLLSQGGEAAWKAFLAASGDQPRLWYSHCAIEDLPCRRIHPASRFVLVLRDPRAVAVSQYFFWRRHPLLGVDPSLDLERFCALFSGGDLYFGDYFRHVLGWLHSAPLIRPEQLCVLRYEDLVNEKHACLNRLHHFLFPDRPLNSTAAAAIVASTDFGRMKQDLSANPGSFHFDPEVFFRAGRCDNWREHLSPNAEALVMTACRRGWAGHGHHPVLAPYLSNTSAQD